MKYLSLSYRMIFNHLFLHIILVLQIIFALLMSGSLISALLLITFSSNVMKPSLQKNYCYFSPMDSRTLEAAGVQNFEAADMNKIVKELTGVKSVCYNNNVVARSETGNPDTDYFVFDLTIQESDVISGTDVPMLHGSWLDEAEKEDDVIRVVTNSLHYSVGDKVKAQCDIDGNKTELTLKIVGIAKNPFPYIGTSGGGDELCSANIVDTCDKKQYDNKLYFGIASAEDFEALTDCFISRQATQNCSIYFDDDLTDEQTEQNFSVLRKYGSVSSAESISYNDNVTRKFMIKENLPEALFLFAAAVIGMSAVSVINISNNVKMLSLFCISGCTRKQLNAIIFAYVMIIAVIALVPVYLIYLISPFIDFLSSYFVMVNWLSFLISFLLVLIFAVISFIFPYRVLKKNPLNQVRNEY